MSPNKKSITWLSLWTLYIVWGSTYYAIALVIKTMPSLLAMGTRLLAASMLLALVLGTRNGWRSLWVSRRQLASAFALGVLSLGMGLGTVSLAQHSVPSGVAALIVSAMPLWVAVFRRLSGDHPSRLSWIGVIVGLGGVSLLLQPGRVTAMNGVSQDRLIFWMLIILLGNLCWSFGTFIAPRFPLPKSALVLTTYETLAAGFTLLGFGWISGEKFSDLLNASLSSLIGWFYLVTFGSILTFSAYLWLVTNARVSLTVTYAYVNPVIAIFLGTVFLREPLNLPIIIGAIVVGAGVAIVVFAETRGGAQGRHSNIAETQSTT
jgi:drug/metabolite transporter (DMT)-like permease